MSFYTNFLLKKGFITRDVFERWKLTLFLGLIIP